MGEAVSEWHDRQQELSIKLQDLFKTKKVKTNKLREPLFSYNVPIDLKEFNRALTPTRFLIMSRPDLQSAAQLLAADN